MSEKEKRINKGRIDVLKGANPNTYGFDQTRPSGLQKRGKFSNMPLANSEGKLNFGSAGHHNRSGKMKAVSLAKLPPFREE